VISSVRKRSDLSPALLHRFILAIDHFGGLGMREHRAGKARIAGAVLTVAGIGLIAAF
jgi:uncharacterized membrane protein YdcZ (DUF606 family)